MATFEIFSPEFKLLVLGQRQDARAGLILCECSLIERQQHADGPAIIFCMISPSTYIALQCNAIAARLTRGVAA